jgi:hypothetical protein
MVLAIEDRVAQHDLPALGQRRQRSGQDLRFSHPVGGVGDRGQRATQLRFVRPPVAAVVADMSDVGVPDGGQEVGAEGRGRTATAPDRAHHAQEGLGGDVLGGVVVGPAARESHCRVVVAAEQLGDGFRVRDGGADQLLVGRARVVFHKYGGGRHLMPPMASRGWRDATSHAGLTLPRITLAAGPPARGAAPGHPHFHPHRPTCLDRRNRPVRRLRGCASGSRSVARALDMLRDGTEGS